MRRRSSFDVICALWKIEQQILFNVTHRLTKRILSKHQQNLSMCYRLLLRTYPPSGVKHTRPVPLLVLKIVLTPLGVA